jgi:hypothetical protein
MPYLIKQLKKAENCMSRKEAQKILKKVERLQDKTYIKPNDKTRHEEADPQMDS